LESSQDDVSDDDPIRSATFLEPEIVAIKLRPIPPPLATETFDISSAPRGQT